MPAWDSATVQEKAVYTSELHQRLQVLQCPQSTLLCDPLCEDAIHSEMRDGAVLDTLLALVETAYTLLPLTGCVPVWPGRQTGQQQDSGVERRGDALPPGQQHTLPGLACCRHREAQEVRQRIYTQ